MKKALKIIGIILGVIIIALIVTPLLFEDEIENKLKQKINENLTAEVNWQNLNLSLISHFPKASLDIDQLTIINQVEFKGDTLLSANSIALEMNVWQLLTSDQIAVETVNIDRANIKILVDEKGVANYNITQPQSPEELAAKDTTEVKNDLNLALKYYNISNSNIVYQDDSSGMRFKLDNFNHSGQGDFVAATTNLNTHTDAKVSFNYGGVDYLNNNSVVLDALLKIDFDSMKFSLLENEALVNQLPLQFNGYVQIFEDYQDINIDFSTPDSDFKNFIGLIPASYAGNLEGIDTEGEFQLEGMIKGQVTETNIPTINITGKSKNARVKYSELPTPIENIQVDLAIINSTGIVEDTYINISNFKFSIGKDQFKGQLSLTDLTNKMNLDLTADGIINLANLKQAYPIESDIPLKGIINSALNAKFSVDEVQKANYKNVNLNGSLGLKDFNVQNEALPKPVNISEAQLKFNTNTAKLTRFNMTAGESDVVATGDVSNIMGFMFNKGILKGNLNATSNYFVVSDFVASTETQSNDKGSDNSDETDQPDTESSTELKIPKVIDLAIKFNANKVKYTTLEFKNMTGDMRINDGSVVINKASTKVFGGQLNLDGIFDTKPDQPNFDFKLGFDLVEITESFAAIDVLRKIAPITKVLDGQMNFDLDFSGKLTQGFDLIKQSLNGKMKAEILEANIKGDKSKLISGLNSNFKEINLDKLQLKDVTALLNFNNGKIETKPFNFKLGDITVNAKGSHSFEEQLSYDLNLNLPSKYLGTAVSAQLAKLSGQSADNINVDVPIQLSGNINDPKFNINTAAAVNQLKTQIINNQKDKVTDKITDKANSLLGKDKPDSTKTKAEETVKNVLGGLLGKKKKKN